MIVYSMNVVAVTVIGWSYCIVAAEEKFCSTSCSTVGMLQSTPGQSCSDVYQFNKVSRGASGNYWINTTTGVHQVYCDMELECGGHKGGWMRIADLDTSRGDDCPTGWAKITTPVTACVAPNSKARCYSTNFPTLNIPYSKICGMAMGYQKSTTDGFSGLNFASRSIDGPYVDGISITFGVPRKHIWTYAIGYGFQVEHTSNCPCSELNGRLPPSFVHENYYCESGRSTTVVSSVFTSNPVWDGQGCSSGNNCCCDPSLPWFYRQIPLTACEDIETRICRDQPSSDEDVLIIKFQLYVQ